MSVPSACPPPLERARSLLFAPASDERKLRRALASDAHAVVADLEDAVAADAKEAAREALARVLAEPREAGGPALLVRVNSRESGLLDGDLEALAGLPLDALMLPKATPEAVAEAAPPWPVLALVETAAGLDAALAIARLPQVVALMLGAADLGAELRLEPRRDGHELLLARSKLVLDSALAGIRAPFDGVHPALSDDLGLREQALLARSLGLRGKGCVHPRQVALVNRAFAPRLDELEWARRVLAALDQGAREGRGAVAVDGEMVDAPVAARARALIVESEEGRT